MPINRWLSPHMIPQHQLFLCVPLRTSPAFSLQATKQFFFSNKYCPKIKKRKMASSSVISSTMNGESDFETEMSNKSTVEALYEALAQGDAETVSALLATDLEWWFHGPPSCQYMMRVLTGQCDHRAFAFLPQNVTAIGSKVFVEGWEGENVYWVHVWTIKNGVITQVREYFNTWITVQDLRPLMLRSGRTEPTLWKSDLAGHCNRSLPGLLVAI